MCVGGEERVFREIGYAGGREGKKGGGERGLSPSPFPSSPLVHTAQHKSGSVRVMRGRGRMEGEPVFVAQTYVFGKNRVSAAAYLSSSPSLAVATSRREINSPLLSLVFGGATAEHANPARGREERGNRVVVPHSRPSTATDAAAGGKRKGGNLPFFCPCPFLPESDHTHAPFPLAILSIPPLGNLLFPHKTFSFTASSPPSLFKQPAAASFVSPPSFLRDEVPSYSTHPSSHYHNFSLLSSSIKRGKEVSPSCKGKKMEKEGEASLLLP